MNTHSDIMPTLIDDVSDNVRRSLTSFVEDGFKHNPEGLSSQMVESLTKGLHQSLLEAGRLALESLIQSFEEDRPQIQVNGRSLDRSDTSEKTFLTLLGEINLRRSLYYEKGKNGSAKSSSAFVPLDYAWDMQGRYVTPEVAEALLYSCAEMVPESVSKLFAKITGIKPSKTLTYDQIQKDGKRLREYVNAHQKTRWESVKVPSDTEVFVASFDGGTLPMRKGELEREKCSGKEGTAMDKTEKGETKDQSDGSSYKNAMIGSFSFYKSKEIFDNSGDAKLCPDRQKSHYIAKMPEKKFIEFKQEATFAVADLEKHLPKEGVIKILLMDGARSLWSWAREQECFEGYDWLLDFYHATEHLSKAADLIFGKRSTKAKKWYRKWRGKLKHTEDAVDGLIRSMGRQIKRLKGKRQQDAEKQRNYFINNREMMNYAIYVAEGLPIGSGPVEAACKTIVKARMCQSGMRWNKESGANVLNLRVLTKSDEWDKMWPLYRDQSWALPKVA
jgi:hypothetical protein